MNKGPNVSRLRRKLLAAAAGTILLLGSATNVLAIDFSIPGDKGQINAKDYLGKVVYVDFWASWCIPCKKSFPWMNQIQRDFAADGLQVIAINVDKDPAERDAFLAKMGANFPIGYDPEGKLAKELGVIGMPSSFIFNRKGELVSKHVGFKRRKLIKYETDLRKALTE